MPSLDLRKITGRIGAQVNDLDINGELDAATVTAIRDALNEHKVLVFDGVHLDDEGQERFAGYFGPLTSAHPTVPSVEGAPNVLPVDSEQGRANHWHTDVTFVVNPPQASTLRSIVVPPYGGETLIANSGAGYRGLPDPLRTLADTLLAVHTNDYDYAIPEEAIDPDERERREVFRSTRYETVHPVVRVHPLTGERARRTCCGTAGRPISSSCSTTGSPSTMRSTTTTACLAGSTGSPSPGTSRSASTGGAATRSAATRPTTRRSSRSW